MTIQWFGQACFKIQAKSLKGDTLIVTDHYADKFGLKKPRLAADIVTVSHEHEDHADWQEIKGTPTSASPFVIKGPGEYEVGDIFVYGIQSWHDNSLGRE